MARRKDTEGMMFKVELTTDEVAMVTAAIMKIGDCIKEELDKSDEPKPELARNLVEMSMLLTKLEDCIMRTVWESVEKNENEEDDDSDSDRYEDKKKKKDKKNKKKE